jgi:hypothetical protein
MWVYQWDIPSGFEATLGLNKLLLNEPKFQWRFREKLGCCKGGNSDYFTSWRINPYEAWGFDEPNEAIW